MLLVWIPLNACAVPLPTAPRRATPEPPAASRLVIDAPLDPEFLQRMSAAGQAPANGGLELAEVFATVDAHLPVLLAVRQEVELAEGQWLASQGGFDTVLTGATKSSLAGFYDTDEFDLEVEQPLAAWGTSLFAGYRYGRGNFAVYDGKAKTNAGGEVRLGARLSLLQGRTIDKRRVALWKAQIAQDRANPVIESRRLEFHRGAAAAYWKWRETGEKLRITQGLLQLARERGDWLRSLVASGLLAEVALMDNDRLIAERESLEIGAQREFEESALALSLYLRDDDGSPLAVGSSRLPPRFPPIEDPIPTLSPDAAVAAALAHRPELRRLQLELESAKLDLDLNRNLRQPKLDLEVFTSQDIGTSVGPDKDPLELGAGLKLEFPMLTREARGRVRQSQARLSQLSHELVWARDRIEVEVRDAISAMTRAHEQIGKAQQSLELSRSMEQAERERLAEGISDLLRVNLREDQRAKAASSLIEAQAEYFLALASYRLAQATTDG